MLGNLVKFMQMHYILRN